MRRELNGLLLTGGASRRLGRDKASIPVGPDGVPLARRLGEMLSSLTDVAVEVGPARSGLDVPDEPDPREGPLGAIAVGWSHLERLSAGVPVLVLATDLPWLSPGCLDVIASFPAADGDSVVPVVGGRLQTLCARWSPAALRRARLLAERGERRVQAAFEGGSVLRLTEEDFARCSPPFDLALELADVDLPEDLRRLGLAVDGGASTSSSSATTDASTS